MLPDDCNNNNNPAQYTYKKQKNTIRLHLNAKNNYKLWDDIGNVENNCPETNITKSHNGYGILISDKKIARDMHINLTFSPVDDGFENVSLNLECPTPTIKK